MPQCTTIREAIWQTKQDCFAIQHAAKSRAETIATVVTQYAFTRDEAQCFFTAEGVAVQMAMTLTDKTTGKKRTVIAKISDDGFWFWFVVNMSGCRHEAGELIEAVQQHVGAKITAHLSGKAVN